MEGRVKIDRILSLDLNQLEIHNTRIRQRPPQTMEAESAKGSDDVESLLSPKAHRTHTTPCIPPACVGNGFPMRVIHKGLRVFAQ